MSWTVGAPCLMFLAKSRGLGLRFAGIFWMIKFQRKTRALTRYVAAVSCVGPGELRSLTQQVAGAAAPGRRRCVVAPRRRKAAGAVAAMRGLRLVGRAPGCTGSAAAAR